MLSKFDKVYKKIISEAYASPSNDGYTKGKPYEYEDTIFELAAEIVDEFYYKFIKGTAGEKAWKSHYRHKLHTALSTLCKLKDNEFLIQFLETIVTPLEACSEEFPIQYDFKKDGWISANKALEVISDICNKHGYTVKVDSNYKRN